MHSVVLDNLETPIPYFKNLTILNLVTFLSKLLRKTYLEDPFRWSLFKFLAQVRYQSRKRLAEQRPRVKGQFVRQVQDDHPVADVGGGS